MFKVIDIVTGEEANPVRIAKTEEWAQDLEWCHIEGFAMTESGSLIIIEEGGSYIHCPDGRFEVEWR